GPVEHTVCLPRAAALEERRVARAPVLGAAVSRLVAAALAALVVAAPAYAEAYYLIVGGLGGEASYSEQFEKDTEALAAVARRTTAANRVTVLQGEGATRDALVGALESLKTRAKAADNVIVMFVGHGSYDGE